jgi:hypothetical protein
MLRGRPTPFEGALVEPKERRFDFITKTERSLQPTVSAISAGGQLLRTMSQICACCDFARFGAILRVNELWASHFCQRCHCEKDRWYVPKAWGPHDQLSCRIGASPTLSTSPHSCLKDLHLQQPCKTASPLANVLLYHSASRFRASGNSICQNNVVCDMCLHFSNPKAGRPLLSQFESSPQSCGVWLQDMSLPKVGPRAGWSKQEAVACVTSKLDKGYIERLVVMFNYQLERDLTKGHITLTQH